jgi:hypothetical protein
MHLRLVAVVVAPSIFWVSEDIVNVDKATFQDGSTRCRASIPADWILLYNCFDPFCCVAIAGRSTIYVSVLPIDQPSVGVA